MQQQSFSARGQTYVRYVFAVGEGLPKHTYDVDYLTSMAAGRIKAVTDTCEVERISSEPRILSRISRFHEIVALEDNTIVLNVFGGGNG